MRVSRIFVAFVGLLWATIVTWFFLMTGGLEVLHAVYLGKALFWYGWMFGGPLFLLIGPLLHGRDQYRMAASVLLAVGCLILSAEVGWILLSVLRDLADPLIAKPPYLLYASGLFLTTLADICTVLLISKWRNS